MIMTGQLTTVNGSRKNDIPLSPDSTTYADVLRGAGYRTGLVGKAHFQNVSPNEAPPPAHRGNGTHPAPPFDKSLRKQRSGQRYECEIRSNWFKDSDRNVPRHYYGFDDVALCIGHGDQVEGHYTGWLSDRLGDVPDPHGRDSALPNEPQDWLQIWRTAVSEHLYPTAYVDEQAQAFLEERDDGPELRIDHND